MAMHLRLADARSPAGARLHAALWHRHGPRVVGTDALPGLVTLALIVLLPAALAWLLGTAYSRRRPVLPYFAILNARHSSPPSRSSSSANSRRPEEPTAQRVPVVRLRPHRTPSTTGRCMPCAPRF